MAASELVINNDERPRILLIIRLPVSPLPILNIVCIEVKSTLDSLRSVYQVF